MNIFSEPSGDFFVLNGKWSVFALYTFSHPRIHTLVMAIYIVRRSLMETTGNHDAEMATMLCKILKSQKQ